MTRDDAMELLKELKETVDQLSEKIDSISIRLDELTDHILPLEKPELEEYLQTTLEAMVKLDKNTNGTPVSRNELAEELDIHPNTAYVRAEKLVKKQKLMKFYGRDLGFDRFEDKKSVFYGIFRTLYNHKYVDQLEKENEVAHMIALTLLQQQPLKEDELFQNDLLSEVEIQNGINYLLNRGLIIRKKQNETINYSIRKLETADTPK